MSFIESRGKKFNSLWIEKYRPQSLDEMILDPIYKQKFSEFLKNEEMPHLLLVGKPGTGKTTFTYILIDKVIKHEMDIIQFNGSLDRGIDIIRNNIVEFCKSPPMLSKFKIVFFDEADKLTDDAQKALRGIIEKYAEDVRFIFTANYLYKIEEAIQSRLQTYQFKSLPKPEILKIIGEMLQKELVTYNQADLNKLVDLVYPDIRKLINELDKFILNNNGNRVLTLRGIDGSAVMKELDVVDKISYIWLNAKNIQTVKQMVDDVISLVTSNQIDYPLVYRSLFDKSSIFPIKAKISKFANECLKVPFEEMHLIQMIWEVIMLIQKST